MIVVVVVVVVLVVVPVVGVVAANNTNNARLLVTLYTVDVDRDKSRLWKKADRLSFERRVRKSNSWVSSDEILNCTQCHTEFTVTVRKVTDALCRFMANVDGRRFPWRLNFYFYLLCRSTTKYYRK